MEEDIKILLELLDKVVEEHHGREALHVINILHSKEGIELSDINISPIVIKALSLKFQLFNIVEENYSMQLRREIHRSDPPEVIADSIEDCIKRFKNTPQFFR